MFYYKIINFYNEFNQPDYKNLNISKNIIGSQFFGEKIAILANTEDKQHKDLVQITEVEYLKLKAEIKEENNGDVEKETFTQTLAELTIENKKKDLMIANLAETVANLTIQVNQMKGRVQ
ncbi:hypothetical protein AAGC94_04395 [Clostridium sporogenes]|uniref:hypothetical protein n=1 Tax=Bacteria TaxID=2 RepID=UPI00313D0FEB